MSRTEFAICEASGLICSYFTPGSFFYSRQHASSCRRAALGDEDAFLYFKELTAASGRLAARSEVNRQARETLR